MCSHSWRSFMIKQWCVIMGLVVWGTGALTASDRAGAAADMEKSVAEIGALLDAKGVIFQPEALASNVQEAVVRAIDPGALILTPEHAKQVQEEEKGVFYDIGLKLTLKNKRPKIMAVTTNGPAETAGVPAGALIEAIDGQSTDGMTLEQVVNRMRGRKNDSVTLTVRSEDKDAEAQTFQVTRAIVRMPVTGTMELWPQQIGYIKINGLYEGSGRQVTAQLNAWSETNCIGIIIDLRGANGINLDAVAEIAGLFSHSTPTFFTVKDGFGKTLKTYAAKNGTPLDQPVMILVNQDTRSAAELLAAVLQNCRGVMIIGVPTRGDDRLREPISLANGKVLIIAVKRIDMGKDSYNNRGAQPDIVVSPVKEPVKVKETADDNGLFSRLSEQDKHDRALIARIGNDIILQRATDILMGLKALDIHAH